ncbi:hypothetical protein RclHR1_03210019 [Rhizophagus clarus]|uniref:Uncharacterized protein n=1 Tax=Rhizophagus clarus TaxID=94130 RepID=A0A2Z6S2Z4_9GLOM|nr:hypothetical protein RclHR1_03210019 [Rhizophagus clarus]
MEPPTSEDLDSLTALVSQNYAKANNNKLRNDLKKCHKLLLKLVTDLSIVSKPATHAQLITNVATLSRMILDSSFSFAELHRHIITDELRLTMWTRDPDLSSNLHKIAPADFIMIEPIVKHFPRLKLSLFQGLVRTSTNVMEFPTSEDLDSLMALVIRNRAKANKL